MKKHIPEISLFMLFAFLNLLAGCHYYKADSIQPVNNEAISKIQLNKYIILHQGNSVWHLNNVTVDNEKNALVGTAESLAADHYFYLNTKVPGANRYKPSTQNPVIEVHIYTEEHATKNGVEFVVPMSAINKIDLY